MAWTPIGAGSVLNRWVTGSVSGDGKQGAAATGSKIKSALKAFFLPIAGAAATALLPRLSRLSAQGQVQEQQAFEETAATTGFQAPLSPYRWVGAAVGGGIVVALVGGMIYIFSRKG